MTCVVGLVAGGKVWIGADSATVWENDIARVTTTRNPKVFRVGPLLIGSAGSGRVQNVLRGVQVPKQPRGQSAFDFVALTVADAIRKAMVEAGTIEREDQHGPDMMAGGSCILIGYKGALYRMDDDFSVDEPHGADAVGCGAAYALGVLEVATAENPKALILSALKAASNHSYAVKGPFKVEVLEP